MSYFPTTRDENSFFSSIHRYGISRPNRFDVLISTPVGSGRSPTNDGFSSLPFPETESARNTALDSTIGDELVSLRCKTIELPGKATRAVAEENIYGPQYEIPHGLTYTNQISATFLLDRNLFVKRYFDAWQEHIQDTGFFDMNYYEHYVRDMIIRQLDEQDNPVYACRVFEVYPSSVESISLSSDSRSAFSELNVTFAFRFWKETVKDLDKGIDPAGTSISDFELEDISDIDIDEKNKKIHTVDTIDLELKDTHSAKELNKRRRNQDGIRGGFGERKKRSERPKQRLVDRTENIEFEETKGEAKLADKISPPTKVVTPKHSITDRADNIEYESTSETIYSDRKSSKQLLGADNATRAALGLPPR